MAALKPLQISITKQYCFRRSHIRPDKSSRRRIRVGFARRLYFDEPAQKVSSTNARCNSFVVSEACSSKSSLIHFLADVAIESSNCSLSEAFHLLRDTRPEIQISSAYDSGRPN
jgi:hypothetical protein